MIRLVASDLDGTLLLNKAQSLNPEIFEYIRRLKKMGILFVAASGRQYDNMVRLFEPVKDDILYICENGAIIFYEGKVIHKSVMERSLGQEMLRAIMDSSGTEALLSGEHTSYIQPKKESYANHLRYVVKNNVTIVEDILEVCEDYMKISLYREEGLEDCLDIWLDRFKSKANVVTSGNGWLDMMPKGVHKGMALSKILDRFQISPAQAVAFGDQYNDLEMLKLVGYDFAMESAMPYVKEVSTYSTGRVESVLEEIIQGEFEKKRRQL